MDSSINSSFSTRENWTVEDVRSQIERSKAVLFGRGNYGNPRCGYTKEAIEALESSGCKYKVVDVAIDPSATAALRAFAGPVALPVMFVDGELVGTSENLSSLISSGELEKKLAQ
jgi:monothiol glutaredoxin